MNKSNRIKKKQKIMGLFSVLTCFSGTVMFLCAILAVLKIKFPILILDTVAVLFPCFVTGLLFSWTFLHWDDEEEKGENV